ncbi:hypothetical protein Moror_8464 [Moniliophthora roreri MCA 2997]|uniref:Uncharacterized protein n=1 Tax=Moniliophthora roreri (strain MCA 2997) TaxID=1381753 RepID=V2W3B1_MONRO|nr:hypothetical protein Moror_8464 [Moniliophthora roreri MCA 2997]
MVGGKVLSEEYKGEVEVEDRENQTPSNDDDLLTTSLRPPMPLPTPMTLLIDRVSALCADWNTISPDIAHSTCVANASQLSLGICLDTALTNEGLATLCIEGLVQVQTLCWIIMIMTINLTTILEENAEESIHNSSRDVDFLFVEADPQKVGRFEGLLSVDKRVATGWQPTQDVLAMPTLQDIDEMPDTSYNYNMELYGDRES